MAVRRSRRKVIGVLSGYGKQVAATSADRRRARNTASAWFGNWFAHTPPWWATRRAHEIKRRKR